MKNLLVCIGCLLLLTGCTQAPPPAPPDTRAADEKAIRDLEAETAKAWTAKDANKILALYAPDASLMVPNMANMKGTTVIKGTLDEMMKDQNIALSFEASTVEVSKAGDYGYTQGTYTMTTTDPKTKKPMVEKGKYVTVYKKQADGSWKAVADINNADAPAAPAASAKK